MSSLIKRAASIYKQEGPVSLLRKGTRKIYRDTYCQFISFLGHYTYSIGDISVSFSAPTSTVVRRNRRRFKSEKKELQQFINRIENDDVVYDIGANTGLYTLFAAKQCSEGEVVSFEPYPPNIDLLKQDISRNELHNVKVLELALSDSNGTIEFDQPSNNDLGYGSSSIQANKTRSSIRVPTTTGDQLIADGEIPVPNIVKIDVEGAEPLVIKGLEQTLSSQKCRTVFCEVHLPGVEKRPSVEDFDSSPEEIREMLKEMGYTIQELPSSGREELFYRATK